MSNDTTGHPIPDFVRTDLQRLGAELPDPMLEQLAQFLDLLLAFNEHTNLTAVRDRDAAWSRLIIDSLTLLFALDGVPEDAQLIDIGTGGGLPGLPVAICRPDLHVTLLDSVGKKIRFCGDAIEQLGLSNVAAVQGRAETLRQDKQHRQRYDVVSSRAVGPMPVVLELSLPLCRVGGVMLAMKGPKLAEEMQDAGDALQLLGAGEVDVYEAYPEDFENDLVIARVVKERATPKQYPRQPGVPKAQPL